MSKTVRMGCECGEELVFETDSESVECPCGAVYAVTVNLLKRPDSALY